MGTPFRLQVHLVSRRRFSDDVAICGASLAGDAHTAPSQHSHMQDVSTHIQVLIFTVVCSEPVKGSWTFLFAAQALDLDDVGCVWVKSRGNGFNRSTSLLPEQPSRL